MTRQLTLTGLSGIPEIEQGTALASVLVEAIARAGLALDAGDVLVIAQKIISKAEGRRVRLSDVTPSAKARELAAAAGKDPRLVELILNESTHILRAARGVIIAEHRLGCILATAGIDQSNVPGAGEHVLLLPQDPQASANRLRDELRSICGVDVGIIINDSLGRPWRNGVIGTALGVAGIPALIDLRGQPDRQGRIMERTDVAAADELAAAASLVMGQAAEGIPAVLARGFPYARRESNVRELLRQPDLDFFR